MPKKRPDPELLTAIETAAMLGIGKETFRQWRQMGVVPEPVTTLPGDDRWRRREIMDWIASGCPNPTSWRWHPSIRCSKDKLVQILEDEIKRAMDDLNYLNKSAGLDSVPLTVRADIWQRMQH